MRRRTWLQGAGAAALASGLAACGNKEAAAPPEEAKPRHAWKMVTSWAADVPGLADAATGLARRITQASGGRLTVTVHAAGTLVPPFEVFDAVSRGTAEMGHSAAYYWIDKMPSAAFFCAVPFGMTAQEMNAWLAHGGGLALWRELYAPAGVVPFAAGNTGMQMAGWFNREIRSLGDLAGLKMRIPGLGGEVLARLGVTTVNLPGADLVDALKSGAIDATEWVGPHNDLAFGLQRVARFCYYPGWQEPGSTLECLVNRAALDALPADLQALVETCCAATNDAVLAEFTARNQQALQVLRDAHHVQFRPLPADVMVALRKASAEVLDAAAARDPFARRVRDSALVFQAQARAWSAVSDAAWQSARR
jgi:TRAP-type mannitol/chloroaromatic compound transport system substrate-binding protein